jgi:hypothetical protein
MLGGRPLQQMEADHNALRSTDPFVRTSSRTPRAGPRGFRLSALTQRSPPTRFDAMSLLFLQLGHGAQRPDWLAGVMRLELEYPCANDVFEKS